VKEKAMNIDAKANYLISKLEGITFEELGLSATAIERLHKKGYDAIPAVIDSPLWWNEVVRRVGPDFYKQMVEAMEDKVKPSREELMLEEVRRLLVVLSHLIEKAQREGSFLSGDLILSCIHGMLERIRYARKGMLPI
jgi:hypothetical protein